MDTRHQLPAQIRNTQQTRLGYNTITEMQKENEERMAPSY